MKLKKATLIATSLMLVGTTACSKGNEIKNTQTDTSQSSSASNPVSSFKTIITKQQAYINQKVAVWNDNNDKVWLRGNAKINDIKYDVKKTDSLVSPYAGIATFDIVFNTQTFATEAEANNNSNSRNTEQPIPSKCRSNYTYQDDKWIVKQQEYGLIINQQEMWFPASGNTGGISIVCGYAER